MSYSPNFEQRNMQSRAAREANIARARSAAIDQRLDIIAATPADQLHLLKIAALPATAATLAIGHAGAGIANAATPDCRTSILVTRDNFEPFKVQVKDPVKGDAVAITLDVQGPKKYDIPSVASSGTGSFPDSKTGTTRTADTKMWKLHVDGTSPDKDKLVTIPCLSAANDPFNYVDKAKTTPTPSPAPAGAPSATPTTVVPTSTPDTSGGSRPRREGPDAGKMIYDGATWVGDATMDLAGNTFGTVLGVTAPLIGTVLLVSGIAGVGVAAYGAVRWIRNHI